MLRRRAGGINRVTTGRPTLVSTSNRSTLTRTSASFREILAFSPVGDDQAVGFGLGLTLGGVFSGTVGWRWGFYATAILNVVVLAIALWALLVSVDNASPLIWDTLTRLRRELDWIEALIISTSLASMFYVLGIVTDSNAGKYMR